MSVTRDVGTAPVAASSTLQLVRQLASRAIEVVGALLLALAPFYPWVHATSPDGFFTVSVSLHDYTTWAWLLTGLGGVAALVSLVPGERYRPVARFLAVVYCVAAVASCLSLFGATDVGSATEVGYGVALALGGWVALVAGSLL